MQTWLEKGLDEYKKEHQNLVNEVLHFFGISMILFSKLFLTLIHLSNYKLLIPFFFLLIMLGRWRGFVVSVFLIALLFLGLYFSLSWKIAIGLFVCGWILLILGHKIFENNNPAFTKGGLSVKGLVHACKSFLIATFWIGEVVGKNVVLYPLWKTK